MGQPVSELHAVGRELAGELRGYAGRPDVVVLAPRPGVVPLAAEVAHALRTPLDLFLVRPLVVPESGGRKVGVVASGGVLVLDPKAVKAQAVPAATIARVAQEEARALDRLDRECRGQQPALDLRHRKVVVIVDGRSDLAMLRMTIAALRRCWVARVVLAAPTMSASVCRELLAEADEIVASLTDEPPAADGGWIGENDTLSGPEIAQFLRRAAPTLLRPVPARDDRPRPVPVDRPRAS